MISNCEFIYMDIGLLHKSNGYWNLQSACLLNHPELMFRELLSLWLNEVCNLSDSPHPAVT